MDGAPGGSRHAGPGPGPGPSPSPPGGPRPAAAGGGGGGGGGSAWVAAPLCLLILLTLLGNGALVLLILSQRALRSTSNFLLASLFLADLLVGGVVMPPAMLSRLHGRWVLGGAFCPLWLAFDVMCSSASILHLGLISLDRYLLILSPLRYKRRMTPGRALLLVLAAWSLAALVSFWPLRMGWHQAGGALRPLNATAPEGEGEGECRLLVSLPYALVASGLTFFLPAVAILFTYCRILLAARRQALQVASLTSNVLSAADEPTEQGHRAHSQLTATSDNRKFASKHSKRALKASLTLGILLGMFFVAWLPFFVCNMVQAACNCVSADFFDLLTWLGYCNSTMNPIIYPLFMRDFKRALAKFLPCCRRAWEPRPTPASLSVRNSHSGPRPGVSLRNVLTLQGDTDSADSIAHLDGRHSQRLGSLPATGADAVALSNPERPAQEPHPLNTPMD